MTYAAAAPRRGGHGGVVRGKTSSGAGTAGKGTVDRLDTRGGARGGILGCGCGGGDNEARAVLSSRVQTAVSSRGGRRRKGRLVVMCAKVQRDTVAGQRAAGARTSVGVVDAGGRVCRRGGAAGLRRCSRCARACPWLLCRHREDASYLRRRRVRLPVAVEAAGKGRRGGRKGAAIVAVLALEGSGRERSLQARLFVQLLYLLRLQMLQRLALGCVLCLLQRRQRCFLLPPSPLHQGPAAGVFRSHVRQRRMRG